MKILIFGNGISIQYTDNVYTDEAMKERFKKFLNYAIQHNVSHSCNIFKYIWNQINIILSKKFNETTFFEIYKLICIKMIEISYGGIKNYKNQGFNTPYDVWDCYYKSILEHNESAADTFCKFIFRWSYEALIHAISLTICTNEEFNNWIEINYKDSFLKYLNSYAKVYTTNYYVDNLENIDFIHGKINIKDKKIINLPTEFRIENIISDNIDNSKIIFGSSYKYKVFISSMLNFADSNSSRLLRKHPCYNITEFNDKNNNFLNDSEVDIVGLSTEGDKHIIEVIKNKCKVINIYCNSESGYKKWEQELSDYKGNKNFFCPHEYKGFDNEPKCIGLCKQYSRCN